ncbi:hypothetical protein [Nocardia sp. NPDC052566]|uniref:hypothetical protein n=1 Tax=Nocardia sp. NPDC052566 TaxID=3364330 RepID=UPI0037C55FF4
MARTTAHRNGIGGEPIGSGLSMRRTDVLDAVAAFLATVVAGATILLPTTFPWAINAQSFEIERLTLSVPHGAAAGVIVASAVAALVTAANWSVAGWVTAALGLIGILANHIAGHDVGAAGALTTLNYVDAVCGGVTLGGLGAVVLHRRATALGFALGGASLLVIGDLSQAFHLIGYRPGDAGNLPIWSVLETPPLWLVAVTVPLVASSALLNRSAVVSRRTPRELSLPPVLAALVLGLALVGAANWLAGHHPHPGQILLAALVTVLAALCAALMLPGRDGVGVLLAACLIAANAALGPISRPGWSIPLLVALTGAGLLAGVWRPSVRAAFAAVAGVAGYAALTATEYTGRDPLVTGLGSAALALAAGYCCTSARPRRTPSAVLAMSTLFLPSIVGTLHTNRPDLVPEGIHVNAPVPAATAGLTALAITLGCVLAVAALYRLRPIESRRTRTVLAPGPPGPPDTAAGVPL